MPSADPTRLSPRPALFSQRALGHFATAFVLLLLSAQAVAAHPKDMTTSSLIVSRLGVRVQTVMPDALIEAIAGQLGAGWSEPRAKIVADGYQLSSESGACRVMAEPSAFKLADIGSRRYVVDYRCPDPEPNSLQLRYALAGTEASGPAAHENFFQARVAGRTLDTVLASRQQVFQIPVHRLLSETGETLAAGFDEQEIPMPGPLDFLSLGIVHILAGTDHVVFLAGLFLLALGWRQLLPVISAFTLGHSLTLGLSALGIYSPEPRIAECFIALSIVYLGAENLHALFRKTPARASNLRAVTRRRWVIAGLFGLIHGFGFSYILADLGLPEGSIWTALIGFNLGVEIGQLMIIAAFVPLLAWTWQRFNATAVSALASVSILLAGCWWFAERALLS